MLSRSFFVKCSIISGVFLVLGIAVIILGFVVLPNVIKSELNKEAVLIEKNADLWAMVPGRSGVKIYKDHYFYDVDNFWDVYYNNARPIAKEKGYYRIQEFTEFINRKYLDYDKKVEFNYFKYHKDVENQTNSLDDKVKTVNVVTLGVWHQAKNAPDNQVALKALYTINKSFMVDFYYGAIQTAIVRKPFGLDKFNYLSEDLRKSILQDEFCGILGKNNAFFIKAVLTHPSKDSEFLMNYFGLTFNEIEAFKPLIESVKAGPLINPPDELATDQWLNMGPNDGQSVQKQNITTPGYIEYGAWAQFERKPSKKPSMTLETAKRLMFTFDEEKPNPDSLINKKNIDYIFTHSDKEAVAFINDVLKVNDEFESQLLYEYLQYISGEMAFGYNRKGTKDIGAIADFLSKALYEVIKNVGLDAFTFRLHSEVNEIIFKATPCEDIFKDDVPLNKIKTAICQDPSLKPSSSTVELWIQGLLYKDAALKEKLKLNEYDYLDIIQDNSPLLKSISTVANKILTDFGITIGNYKAMNIMPLAVSQMLSSAVTTFPTERISLKSVKDIISNSNKYKAIPEFHLFCKEHFTEVECEIEKKEFLGVLNFDNLFSSLFIQNKFIEYKEKQFTSFFNKKPFISYMRYIMLNEVLNFFTERTVRELLWGYEDDLLKEVKKTIYFEGGDPSIDTKFSFLNNMTETPNDPNAQWGMYTGMSSISDVRQIYKSHGAEQFIRMREKVFDGEKEIYEIRNPWKIDIVLNGTDAMTFNPLINKTSEPWLFLDDLYRTGQFVYYSTLKYNKLKVMRFTLKESVIQSSKYNPFNANYYSEMYNGFGNMTSVFKAPLFASKPYYYQCPDSPAEQSNIIKVTSTIQSKDKDDVKLADESWIDIEPNSGAVLRAAQKILLSAYIETDNLFEMDTRFIPIYSLFRSGNFTAEQIKETLGPLTTGLFFSTILQVSGIIILAIALGFLLFSLISLRILKNKKVNAILVPLA